MLQKWGATSTPHPQHIHPLFIDDIYGYACCGQPVQIGLQLRKDPTILLHEGQDPLVIAIPLETENLFRESVHGIPSLLKVHSVSPGGLIPEKSPHVLEEVEPSHIRPSVSTGGTEADGPEDGSREGGHVLPEIMIRGQLSHLLKSRNHVKPQDVGLPLFQRGSLVPHGLPYGATPIQEVLDAQAVGHLMEHGVLEEGIEGYQLPLILCHEHVGNGGEYPIELGPHGILELKPSGTPLKLHLWVVGQVDGDGLGAGVCVPSHKDTS